MFDIISSNKVTSGPFFCKSEAIYPKPKGKIDLIGSKTVVSSAGFIKVILTRLLLIS